MVACLDLLSGFFICGDDLAGDVDSVTVADHRSVRKNGVAIGPGNILPYFSAGRDGETVCSGRSVSGIEQNHDQKIKGIGSEVTKRAQLGR